MLFLKPEQGLWEIPALKICPIPDNEKKINLNFYFHTSLLSLKRFYGGLWGLFLLLVVLLNTELHHNFFVIIFFLSLLQDSAITW